MRELLLREWPLYPSLIPLFSGGLSEDRLCGRKDTAKQSLPCCQQPGSQSAGALHIVCYTSYCFYLSMGSKDFWKLSSEYNKWGFRKGTERQQWKCSTGSHESNVVLVEGTPVRLSLQRRDATCPCTPTSDDPSWTKCCQLRLGREMNFPMTRLLGKILGKC